MGLCYDCLKLAEIQKPLTDDELKKMATTNECDRCGG